MYFYQLGNYYLIVHKQIIQTNLSIFPSLYSIRSNLYKFKGYSYFSCVCMVSGYYSKITYRD